MSRSYFCKNSVYLFLVFHLPVYLSDNEKNAKLGPFRSTIQNVKACDTPSRPYMQDPPMKFIPINDTSTAVFLLSGNITISRDTKNVKFRIRSSIWENNKWKVNYIMNDINCHSMLLYMICSAINLKYDRKTCVYFKGAYNFKNLDINTIQHLWASKMEYGKVLWRVEVFSPQQGTFFCYDFVTVCEPAET